VNESVMALPTFPLLDPESVNVGPERVVKFKVEDEFTAEEPTGVAITQK